MKRAAMAIVLALVVSGVFVAVIGAYPMAAGSDTGPAPMRSGTYSWRFYDFFNVPYDTWWTDSGQRKRVYGDVILSNTYPYTNWYPWAEDRYAPTIYTMYRIDMSVTGADAWNLVDPVILPEFGPATTMAPITVDWYMQYVSNTRRTELRDTGCIFISSGLMDGFIMETTATFTMDLSTAEHLFGVTGDPATWWAANTKAGCTNYGALEADWETWLYELGNGAYDIYNSFEYPYSPWFTDVSATISGNTVTVSFHHVTWGIEVLMARWMYYGATTYASQGTPAGWWPWELSWFEAFRLTGTIGTTSNFALTTAMAYHFQASALPGPDGTWGNADDIPTWYWAPILTDYLYTSLNHPVSELTPYEGRTTIHTTPGSRYYGTLFKYTAVPKEWDLLAGETLTIDFSEGNIPWYSPQSPKTSDPADLVSTSAPLTLLRRIPAAGTWDEVTNTWTVTGVLDPGLPPNPDYGAPWVEIGVETAPPPVVSYLADLVRRSAWPERHHYVISADPDGILILYGKAENLGTKETWVLVRFTVSKNGGPATDYYSAVESLLPGQRWDFTVGLTGLTPGKYSVSAQAWYDTDDVDLVPDTAGMKVKEFSFSAVP